MVTETQTWRHSSWAPHCSGDHRLAVAQHRLHFKTPFAGIQGGPRTSPLPGVPRGWPGSSHRHCSWQRAAASPANRKFLCNGGPGYSLALWSQIVHGSVFSPVQPGIPGFRPGICHFTAARSSTSCSLFPVGTWLQIILSMLFSTQERALFSHPAANKRGNQEAGQEFFWVWGGLFVILRWGTRAGMQQSGLFPKLRFMRWMF